MDCKKCNSLMTEISRERVLDEMDENLTEGQMAEYMASLESGETNDIEYTEITYKCEKCGAVIALVEI